MIQVPFGITTSLQGNTNIIFDFEIILVDVHENVTYKYVEVNPTGKKDIGRQTQEPS